MIKKDYLLYNNFAGKTFQEVFGNLVKDYWRGSYRNIEYKAIAVVVFTLLYVMSTIDLIPDFIPGMGLLDDASVIAFCLNIVKTELDKYKEWKLV